MNFFNQNYSLACGGALYIYNYNLNSFSVLSLTCSTAAMTDTDFFIRFILTMLGAPAAFTHGVT